MSTTAPARRQDRTKLDTITASLVARQSRSHDGTMSVPDQVASMEEWAARQTPPVQIGAIYEEVDQPGRVPLEKRKGLKLAVADVEEGRSQMVLTAYFDRLTRSVATRAEVVQRVEAAQGVVMTMDLGRTSDATPVSKFTGTVLAAAAELIAEQAGEKTAVTKQRNIDNGVPPFPRITPAYQRRADGTLEPHEVNAPIIREAIALRLDGMSWTKLTRWLNERGIDVTPSGLQSMFASPLLKGEIHFGSFRPNLHAIAEPIVDAQTFRRLQSSRASRGRQSRSPRLLARLGVLHCASCGARMVVDNAARGASGERYAYYRCGNRMCEAPALVSAEVAEEQLRDETIRLGREVTGRASVEAEVEAARLAREAAEAKLANAIQTLAGLGAEAATREVLDELQGARDEAVDEHERLVSLTASDALALTLDDWVDLTFDERRDAIRAVVESATVSPGRGPGRIAVEPR